MNSEEVPRVEAARNGALPSQRRMHYTSIEQHSMFLRMYKATLFRPVFTSIDHFLLFPSLSFPSLSTVRARRYHSSVFPNFLYIEDNRGQSHITEEEYPIVLATATAFLRGRISVAVWPFIDTDRFGKRIQEFDITISSILASALLHHRTYSNDDTFVLTLAPSHGTAVARCSNNFSVESP